MADSEDPIAGCCSRCISNVFTSGLSALALWLIIRVSSPICSIEDFDYATVGRNQTIIHYDLKLNNKNIDKGIYYDLLNLAFYYHNRPNNYGMVPIGNATFPGFYQGHRKSTHRVGSLDTRGVKWENDSTAVLRAELVSVIRYKTAYGKTEWQSLMVGAELKVNDDGKLVKGKDNKGIKLIVSAAQGKISNICFGLWTILGVLVFFYFL